MCACGCVCIQKAKITFPCKNALATATTTHTEKPCLNWTITLFRQDQIFTVTHTRIYTINSCADKCQSSNYTLAKITSHADQRSQQKMCFVATNTCMLVVTKVLSRQNYVCRDKGFGATSILLSRRKTWFVATNTCLSRRNVCHNKNDTCGSSLQW